MTAPMRLVDTGLRSARRNVAITAAMAELHRVGQIPDTLRLCLYPRSVLVGCRQAADHAVHLKRCRRSRIEVARRVTDGGAVYLSGGVLAWDVVAERYRFGVRTSDVCERICCGIAAGLVRFGLPARFRPPGDVEIDGRTISATSGMIDGPTIVFQGTVLIDLAVAEMAAVLRSPAAPRRRDATADLARRVTSLSEWLGRVPSVNELRGLLVAGVSHHWGCDLYYDAAGHDEVELAERLLDEGVGTDAFAAAPLAAPANAAHRAMRA